MEDRKEVLDTLNNMKLYSYEMRCVLFYKSLDNCLF